MDKQKPMVHVLQELNKHFSTIGKRLASEIKPNSEINLDELNCDSALILRDGEWLIETLK